MESSGSALEVPASRVEAYFLQENGNWKIPQSQERIKVVTVANYVLLGQLTALRFLEYVTGNPEGVVALPTGKTPEYFIKWMHYYQANWASEAKDGLLSKVGLTSPEKPRMDGLRFVQLDEFFPIRPDHERSFAYFIKKFYLQGFGLDPHRALLIDSFGIPKGLEEAAFPFKNLQEVFAAGDIDLDVRVRQPANEKEALHQKILLRFDEFCEAYEGKIRDMGGIGFFLGGIGPDGHVAFNIRGTSHHSTTRLDKLNYESQAAASTDLGGIDAVRKKAVITIGLGTITYRPDAVAIIMAAGETKAPIVAAALENPPSIQAPASCLQQLPNARFFLTLGSSSRLKARRQAMLSAQPGVALRDLERLVIDGALSETVPGLQASSSQVNAADVPEWRLAAKLSRKQVPDLLRSVEESIKAKIQRGQRLPADQIFLHTAPHHDDIELAYFPVIHHLVRSEKHQSHFCYLTSGFTAVTNQYLGTRLKQLANLLLNGGLGRKIALADLRNPATAQQEIHGYLKAIAGRNREAEEYFTACRLSRFVFERRQNVTADEAHAFVRSQIGVLDGLEPGQVDPEAIQLMKGWIREWEAELVWAHFGHGRDHVHHLRLKFYTGAIFPDDPDYQRDVVPVLQLLEKVKPNIVTVAMDPEGSGPDTHFKVLIAVARALEEYVRIHGEDVAKDLRVYGYRNIWSRYHISEADTIVPISLNSFAVLDSMFNACFISQRTASFPSHELNGTFSELAQKIWVEQHNDLNKLMGREFFYGSTHPMMRRAYGAIYLKDMSYPEFRAEMEPMYRFLDSKKNLLK
ncbi:MAG: glucosamine/galactosamine-6-phosphate isomerase [Fibrobacteres bacterium]|nr:glucosamine/galactosamine-6-phosphate isomerase [Fibrobacterota bacterium]